MSYTPTKNFCTSHMMRLLLAECPTVRELMEVNAGGTEAQQTMAALAKIHHYATPIDLEAGNVPITFPRILVHEHEVHMETDQRGDLIDVQQRTIDCCIEAYIPALLEVSDANDEKAWFLDKLSDVNSEVLARTGRGEPVTGRTHLFVQNPVLFVVQREPDDERGDPAIDIHVHRPRWFGTFAYEVH